MTRHNARNESAPPPSVSHQDIKNYYDVAGVDYHAWSPSVNMHFGYIAKWTDIFSLEKMLNQLSRVAIEKLALRASQAPRVLDMGCGVGTVARELVRGHADSTVIGVTIVDSQIAYGNMLSARMNLQTRVQLMRENYENMSFEDQAFDAAYAIESMCHAQGDGKSVFVTEMARVLKPGGRFVVLDGFLKTPGPMPYVMEVAYRHLCRCWALPCLATLGKFEDNLKLAGFKNIQMEEISWRVAPSVAYVPFVTLKFLIQQFWKRKSLALAPERWNNLASSLLTMFLGLWRHRVGYYVVSGEKV
jgi:ubiquinone/menaquinone biosynthesis C-methylase UbiE